MKQHRSLFLSFLGSFTFACLAVLCLLHTGCRRVSDQAAKPHADGEVSSSGIERDDDGLPVIVSGGKPLNILAGRWGFMGGYADHAYDKLGLDMVEVSLNVGSYSPRVGYVAPVKYMPPFWNGPGQYMRGSVLPVLARAAEANPKAKFLVTLAVDNYPEMGFADPERALSGPAGGAMIVSPDAKPSDDVIRNETGQSLIRTGHFQEFRDGPPQPGAGKPEQYGISYMSERFRRESVDAIHEVVREVEASPYANRVIGYSLKGGQDAQLYSWSPPDGVLADPSKWGDYSPVARAAFRKWAAARYRGDVTNLNRAWGTQFASFDEVSPPPAAELCGGAAFHNPVSERRSYDFKRFLAEGRADFIEGLARAVKESASRPVFVAAWGMGDGGHRRDNTVVSRMMRSPHIDAGFHQPGYGVRIPPAVGGMNALLDSYALNGKIFLADMDHRLWTGRPKEVTTAGVGVTFNDDSVGRPKDMVIQRDMWRREFARLWAAGHNGATLMNFGPTEEWDHPELREEIARIKKFGDDRVASAEKTQEKNFIASSWHGMQKALNITKKAPEIPASEVAFVFDEEAVDWARSALPQFHMGGMIEQWNEAHASGVPVRYYYAADFREGLVPSAKLVVLQNLLDIDEATGERIKALRIAGATIVVLQGTGHVQLRTGREAFVDDVLGLKLRPLDAATTEVQKGLIDAAHPLLAGDKWNKPAQSLAAERIKEIAGFSLAVDDPSATALTHYPTSGKVAAAAIRPTSGGQVVFVGAYNLSREAISRLAAWAGSWRMTSPGNAIVAAGDFVVVQSALGGKVELDLRSAVALKEMQPGTVVSPASSVHTLELEKDRVYFLQTERDE
ncbi:MAG: beta-galactosidase [Verrucomicrobiota bacterium]